MSQLMLNSEQKINKFIENNHYHLVEQGYNIHTNSISSQYVALNVLA